MHFMERGEKLKADFKKFDDEIWGKLHNDEILIGMSRRSRTSSLVTSDGLKILDLILSREGSGIQVGEIKNQLKIPATTVITKANNKLVAKGLIKEVKGVKGRKFYMGVHFTPSDEVSGGIWYKDGKINTGFVDRLKKVCREHLMKSEVATLEGLHKAVQESLLVEIPKLQKPQMAELLDLMVLDNELVEAKRNGLGQTCYRLASASVVEMESSTDAFASIPCLVCPRIALCRPDGVVSPATCVYYDEWFDIENQAPKLLKMFDTSNRITEVNAEPDHEEEEEGGRGRGRGRGRRGEGGGGGGGRRGIGGGRGWPIA